MDKLSSLARFKASCPFLRRSKTSTLRTLCTVSSPRYPTVSKLTERATKCPVMGPALAARSPTLAHAMGYASLAGNDDVQRIHAHVFKHGSAGVEECPHAAAARKAAQMASDFARAKKSKFEARASTSEKKAEAAPSKLFDYEAFYMAELDKKHQDKSYRYFNNINRLANEFPVAHTGAPEDKVTVWCANDYLGMGKNPVVLETMQYVKSFFSSTNCSDVFHVFLSVAPLIPMVTVLVVLVTSQATVLSIYNLRKSLLHFTDNLLRWFSLLATLRMTRHFPLWDRSSPAVSSSPMR